MLQYFYHSLDDLAFDGMVTGGDDGQDKSLLGQESPKAAKCS